MVVNKKLGLPLLVDSTADSGVLPCSLDFPGLHMVEVGVTGVLVSTGVGVAAYSEPCGANSTGRHLSLD